jgi:hypothetical protein
MEERSKLAGVSLADVTVEILKSSVDLVAKTSLL